MLEELICTVRKAGEILKHYYDKVFEVNHKGLIDLVTTADFEVEKFIRNELIQKYPQFPLIGEEGGEGISKAYADYYFLLDPLDGTTNFVHSLPWFAIALALMKDLEPQIGIIYNPITEELFFGEKDKGSYLNYKPIKVSLRKPLLNSLLATGFPVAKIMEKPKHFTIPFEEFLQRCRGIRRFGAASLDLAYVACGRYDGFFEPYLKPWDTAAGILLVKEAGGMITDYLGYPYHPYKDTLVASNGLIHNEMLEILHQKHPETFKPFRNPLPAVDIIIEYKGGIVLIERKNPPLGWALPGGFIEYGETAEEAAIREAKEETNLNIKIKKLLGCYSDPKRDPRFHTISLVFVAEGKGELQGKDDAKLGKVFKIKEIPWNALAFDHGKILKDYLQEG